MPQRPAKRAFFPRPRVKRRAAPEHAVLLSPNGHAAADIILQQSGPVCQPLAAVRAPFILYYTPPNSTPRRSFPKGVTDPCPSPAPAFPRRVRRQAPPPVPALEWPGLPQAHCLIRREIAELRSVHSLYDLFRGQITPSLFCTFIICSQSNTWRIYSPQKYQSWRPGPSS